MSDSQYQENSKYSRPTLLVIGAADAARRDGICADLKATYDRVLQITCQSLPEERRSVAVFDGMAPGITDAVDDAFAKGVNTVIVSGFDAGRGWRGAIIDLNAKYNPVSILFTIAAYPFGRAAFEKLFSACEHIDVNLPQDEQTRQIRTIQRSVFGEQAKVSVFEGDYVPGREIPEERDSCVYFEGFKKEPL